MLLSQANFSAGLSHLLECTVGLYKGLGIYVLQAFLEAVRWRISEDLK